MRFWEGGEGRAPSPRWQPEPQVSGQRMKKERSPNKPGQSRLELSKQGPDTGQVTPPL